MSKFEMTDNEPTGIVIHKRQSDGSIKKFSADKEAAPMDRMSAAKAAVAKAQNRRTVSLAVQRRRDIDLSGHVPGTPYKYKHGWVPLAHGEQFKAGDRVLHTTSGKHGTVIKTNAGAKPWETGREVKVKIDGASVPLDTHAVHLELHESDPRAAKLTRGGKPVTAKDFRKSPNEQVAAANAHNEKLFGKAQTTAEHKASSGFGPTREEMIQNAEKMYGTDRGKWSVAALKKAVTMGDTRSSAELKNRAKKGK